MATGARGRSGARARRHVGTARGPGPPSVTVQPHSLEVHNVQGPALKPDLVPIPAVQVKYDLITRTCINSYLLAANNTYNAVYLSHNYYYVILSNNYVLSNWRVWKLVPMD